MDTNERLQQARHVDALCVPELVGRVDGIAERLGDDHYRFRSPLGSVTWNRVADEHGWRHRIESQNGVNILDRHSRGADSEQESAKYLSLAAEQHEYNNRPTPPTHHGRMYAYDSLSQLFDDPKTPDLLLVPAAGFPMHGNLGNHGSLTSVQSRGLFFASGCGVAQHVGWAPNHARMIDVAPTILAILGAPFTESRGANGLSRCDARIGRQFGEEIQTVLDPQQHAKHVVVILMDGTNTNLLADVMTAGEAPALHQLLSAGVGLREGIISSFPTVTLPNHVTAFTGVHPGCHGVINNEFLAPDGRHVNLLEFKDMINTCDWLSPQVETLHEAIHRWNPDAFTSAMYEYVDRGADWSTFDEFRNGRRPPNASEEQARNTSSMHAYENAQYKFMARVDESALAAALHQWAGPAVTGHPLPTLQLLNINLTDTAGHESGPHGYLARTAIQDTDSRVARLLDAIDAAHAREDTAIVVMSDHGMEQCSPDLLAHPHADLAPLLMQMGRREIGDALLYPA